MNEIIHVKNPAKDYAEALKALPTEQFFTSRDHEKWRGFEIGMDRRLYRTTTGLATMRVPVSPVEATEPRPEFVQLQLDRYPSLALVKGVYEQFLKGQKTEVVVIVGRRWDNDEFTFMIPRQEVDINKVKWDDKEGMEWFDTFARYLGTIHIHPGTDAGASGLDIEAWTPLNASGIHVIVGRSGAYTVSGSAGGYCAPNVYKGNLSELKAEQVEILHSLERPLEELLIPWPKPKPKKFTWFDKKGKGRKAKRGWWDNDEDDNLFTPFKYWSPGDQTPLPWNPWELVVVHGWWDDGTLEDVAIFPVEEWLRVDEKVRAAHKVVNLGAILVPFAPAQGREGKS